MLWVMNLRDVQHGIFIWNEVAWPLFLFCMVGKTRSRWSLAGMTELRDLDKFLT